MEKASREEKRERERVRKKQRITIECLCVTFFRMFVTTLVFTRKQEAVAQDAKAITTKEKEGRRKKLEGHGLHACKSEYSSKISS
jgi:hypothetical protein